MDYRDWVITKRQLGMVLALAGLLIGGGLLALDLVRGGGSDFGPTQQAAVAGCAVLFLVGLSLLPFGDRPA